jgi:hypothetical protein
MACQVWCVLGLVAAAAAGVQNTMQSAGSTTRLMIMYAGSMIGVTSSLLTVINVIKMLCVYPAHLVLCMVCCRCLMALGLRQASGTHVFENCL